MSLSRPSAFILLAGICAVGLSLRLYGLDAESAWLDEAFAIGIARVDLEEVLYHLRLDVHPPLYYLLLRGWIALLDGSVWTARLLSVVCSVALIAVAYGAAARLIDRTAGLTTATLLAVSVFHVEFAQEARMYALLACLATVSAWSFSRLFGPPRLAWFVLFVVSTALMVHTQVYGLFVIGGQAATVALDVWRRRQEAVEPAARWIAALALVFAAFLPWLPVFTWQVALVQDHFWIGEPEPAGLVAVFRTFTGSTPLLLLAATLAVGGAVALSRRPRPEAGPSALLLLLPWLAGPILIPFGVSLISSPIFLPKYTIAASVPFAILTAAGITALPRRTLQVLALAACVVLSLSTLPAYYELPVKDGWREAVPLVEREAAADDAIVLYPYFNQIAFDFYRERQDLQVRPFPLFTAPPPADGWPAAISRATAGRARVWLVTLRFDASSEPVRAALARDFALVSHQVRQKLAIFCFERR
jgi:mannosyltransferase